LFVLSKYLFYGGFTPTQFLPNFSSFCLLLKIEIGQNRPMIALVESWLYKEKYGNF